MGCDSRQHMASRTRNKGTITRTQAGMIDSRLISGSSGWLNPRNGQVSPPGVLAQNGYFGFSDNRRSMTDETQRVGLINNCVNNIYDVPVQRPPACTFALRNTSWPFGLCVFEIGGMEAFYYLEQDGLTHLDVPSGAAIAAARIPAVNGEMMSGLNSLYELKDLKDALEVLPVHLLWAVARRKRVESLRELSKWLDSMKRVARDPVAFAQALVGADLAWKFGWKPMLDDIQKVHSELGRVNSKIEKLTKQQFPTRGKFTDSRSVTTVLYDGQPPGAWQAFNRKVVKTKTTTSTWVYGSYKGIDPVKLPSFDSLRASMLRESLGLTLDATDLWEAVPYSFVVDWFLPIQTFLEQFKGVPTPDWVVYKGHWGSVKTTTEVRITEIISPITTGNELIEPRNLTRTISGRRTTYTRQRMTTPPKDMLHPTYIPRPKLPNFGQFVTGIELVLQRIPKQLK